MPRPIDVHLRGCRYGTSDRFEDGLTHVKTVPECIVAQCLRGRYEVWAGDAHATIAPGECFLTGAMHRVRIRHHHDAAGVMAARWVHLSLERCAGVDALAAYRLPLRLAAEDCAVIAAGLDALAELGEDDGSLAWRLAWRRWGYTLGDELLRRAWPHALPGSPLWLAPVFSLVERELARPLAVADLAAAVHLSPARFHAVFKRDMGTAPMTWLRRVRLQRAAQELLASEDGIQAVAARCGFASPFHFSRCFKAWTGQSPRAWRSDHRDRLV